jgi:RNA polymerase sigma-70 factor (ECF subfamily)
MAQKPDDLIPTRRSLLIRLKNWEDQESWKDFFDTYWRLIYAVAVKAGLTDAEAQEVVQETVIAVARKMQEFKYDPGIGSFKGWLLHTSQWKISDQLRKRQREAGAFGRRHETTTRTSTVGRIPDPAGFDLEAIWDREWQRNIFDAAIEKVKRQVKARQYQIFDLYVIKQWPVQKVARTLGVNVGRVYLAKHRISALLKNEMGKLESKMT